MTDVARLMGRYTHNLDQQNRLQIPAKMRTELGDSFVLTYSTSGDRCLLAYSFEDWDASMDALAEETPSRKTVLRQRQIYMYTDKIDLDGQGRMTIPSFLKEKAGFENEVFMLGAGSHLELWNPDEYKKMLEENEEQFETQLTYLKK